MFYNRSGKCEKSAFVQDSNFRGSTANIISWDQINELHTICTTGYWRYSAGSQKVIFSEAAAEVLALDEKKASLSLGEFLALLDPALRHKAKELFFLTVGSRSPYHFEARLADPAMASQYVQLQALHYYDKSGNHLESAGIVENITSRKAIEQQLLEGEEYYRNLFNVAADAAYLMDADGSIIDVNTFACQITGYEKDELRGMSVADVDINFDIEKFKAFWKDVPLNKNFVFETEHKRKSGECFPVEVSGVVFELDGHRQYFGLARDLTERQETEKQLKELNQTKDKFFSILSHDLRNPIHAIAGAVSLLKEKCDDHECDDVPRIINLIDNAAEQTYAKLTDVLDWARVQTGRMQVHTTTIEVEAAVSKVLAELHLELEAKNVQAEVRISAGLTIDTDERMLDTILSNLIENAIKFSYEGAIIRVTAIKDGENVRITVKDEGVGIAEERLGSLFSIDHHISTKGTAGEKGTGLGLILCREFTEQLGGTINVQSKLGEGTTFTVQLPVNSDRSA